MLFFQQVNPQIFSFIPVAVFTFPIWSIGNNGQEPCRPLSPWPSWLLRSWTWQCRAEQYPKHPETSRGGICIIHLHITQRKVQISRKKSKIGLVYQLNLIMVSLHKHRSYLKPKKHTILLYIPGTPNNQFFRGCLVMSNHFPSKALESSNWNNHLKQVV